MEGLNFSLLGTRVAEVDGTRNCHIFKGEDAQWFILTRKDKVVSISDNRFGILQNKCNRIAVSNPSNNNNEDEIKGRNLKEEDESGGEGFDVPTEWLVPDEFPELENITFGTSSGFPLIFPGTKWCGAGDTARSATDLGLYIHTDNCCRDHDTCPDNIPKGECKEDYGGLCNDASFTRSHCDCDEAFLKCLRTDTTLSAVASFKIAHVYFNLLKPLCFAKRHPIKEDECTKRRLTGECVKHRFDYKRPIMWQFFPAQPYEPVQRTIRKLTNPSSLLPGGDILPSPPSPRLPLPLNPLRAVL